MTDAASGATPKAGGLGVGKALADARQAQGLALADVAQQLKFMPRQLDALEHERFNSLPGPTIARGMVRSYARLLKLDPEPLLAAMAGHVEAPDATPQLALRYSQPVPFSDNGRRSTVLYLALSACVLALAVAAVHEWRQERDEPVFIAAAKQPAAPAPAQTASTAPVSIAAPEARPSPAPPEPEPKAEPPAPQPSAKAEAEPSPKAEAPPPPPARTAVAADSSAASSPAKSLGTHRIVFHFEEEAWIEVTDGAGRLLASSLNPAGSERVLHGKPPFNLVIGNASNVRLRYNDREIDLEPHVKVEVARFTLK